MNKEIEQWKQWKDTNYEASNLGRIRNKTTKHILSENSFAGRNKKYKIFWYCCNKTKKRKPMYFHIVVAQTWIPNPNNLPEVNHQNGNAHDNNISNLEWCTSSQNRKHAYDTGLFRSTVCPKCNKVFFVKGKEVCSDCTILEERKEAIKATKAIKVARRSAVVFDSKISSKIKSLFYEGVSFEKIGKEFGVTKQAVSQLIKYHAVNA